MDEFLTLKETADLLHVCYETARRLSKRKVNPLPYNPITHRVYRPDLIEWQRKILDEMGEDHRN